jgi:hypothetical protein
MLMQIFTNQSSHATGRRVGGYGEKDGSVVSFENYDSEARSDEVGALYEKIRSIPTQDILPNLLRVQNRLRALTRTGAVGHDYLYYVETVSQAVEMVMYKEIEDEYPAVFSEKALRILRGENYVLWAQLLITPITPTNPYVVVRFQADVQGGQSQQHEISCFYTKLPHEALLFASAIVQNIKIPLARHNYSKQACTTLADVKRILGIHS